jgi:hypothetical protein
MGRNLGSYQSDAFLTASFAKPMLAKSGSLPGMHWNAAPQIGQAERCPAVAAIRGAQNGEKRRILVDGQQLAIAKSIATGSKVAGEYLDFSYERFRHDLPPVLRPARSTDITLH